MTPFRNQRVGPIRGDRGTEGETRQTVQSRSLCRRRDVVSGVKKNRCGNHIKWRLHGGVFSFPIVRIQNIHAHITNHLVHMQILDVFAPEVDAVVEIAGSGDLFAFHPTLRSPALY